MKILVIADIDEFHWEQGPGQADILVSCGDVVDQVILEAAEAYGCQTIFSVKGNHDSNVPFPDPIIDLHKQTAEHRGLLFGGLNGSWRYKPRGAIMYDQKEIFDLLSEFPRVDVFISHNSPKGIHDKNDEVHIGFDALHDYITNRKPRLLIHGHQHVDAETKIHQTRVIGIYGHKMIEV